MWRIQAFLIKEWSLFTVLPRNAKLLLKSSTVSNFAMPVIGIFVHALILRNTNDMSQVMSFQSALYVGIPVAFLVNRFLAGGRATFAHLYALGIILCGLVMLTMTGLDRLTRDLIIGMGFLMGLATGFHWANRNYLSLVCTHESYRNYYFGVETFINCISNVVVPGLVGWFIARRVGADAAPGAIGAAYKWVAGTAFVLLLYSASFLVRGSFPMERPAIRVRSRVKPVWRKMLVLAALKGSVQIFMTTAPAILVMRVLGGTENALGWIQSVGAVCAAVLMYGIGRTTRPEHRVAVLAVALLLFGLGATVNALFYDRSSVLVFLTCLLVAQPMMDLSYNPMQLSVMDAVAGDGEESRYAYVVSHELGIFSGRFIGAVTFAAVAAPSTSEQAFRYVLALLALVQLCSWPLAVSIRRDLSRSSPAAP